MGDEPTRRQRADELVSGLIHKRQADKLTGALLLGSLGMDPRDFLDDG
jgi:hypothetical protein